MKANTSGFTLVEFVIAASFFCFLLLVGYEAVDSQTFLHSFVQEKTRSDREANYRFLILRNLLEDSSETLKQDPLTAGIPVFFPNVHLDDSTSESQFLVAVGYGVPVHFFRDVDGTFVIPAISPLLKAGDTVALGGNDENTYCWNYGRIRSSSVKQGLQRLDIQLFLSTEPPSAGSLIPVRLNGFEFQENTVYWISPSGNAEPFWEPLDQFSYQKQDNTLVLVWQRGTSSGRGVIGL